MKYCRNERRVFKSICHSNEIFQQWKRLFTAISSKTSCKVCRSCSQVVSDSFIQHSYTIPSMLSASPGTLSQPSNSSEIVLEIYSSNTRPNVGWRLVLCSQCSSHCSPPWWSGGAVWVGRASVEGTLGRSSSGVNFVTNWVVETPMVSYLSSQISQFTT